MSDKQFDKKLIEGINPFPYPHPPDRPPFIIGGDSLLSWFARSYRNTKRQEGGTISYFVVGRPGAGKTYFFNHLEYLFYQPNGKQFDGIYAHISLSDQEFPESSVWKELFGGEKGSKQRLATLIPKDKIDSLPIRKDVKENLLKLFGGNLYFSSSEYREIAKEISNLLPEEAVICIALDNVEEYIDARKKDAQSQSLAKTEKESIAYAVDKLMGSIRNMTDPLRKGMVMLAITDEIWPNVEEELRRIGRTKARRAESAENMILGTLSLPQCLQLVHEYMQHWCTKNGLTLPQDQKDCLYSIESKTVSIYPFTPMAIEFAYEMTDKLPGDISCFCSKCIDILSNKGQVEVIKDKLIIEAMRVTAEARKALGWVPNAQRLINEMGPLIQEQSLLEELGKLKHEIRGDKEIGLTHETIVASLNQFVNLMGVEIRATQSVPSCINERKTILPNPLLEIWSFAETKFAVRYVIGDPRFFIPTARLYGDRVDSQPYEEIMSLINSEEATHGLLITLFKLEDRFKLGHIIMDELRNYGTTIQSLDLSEKLENIMAIARARDDKELLARLVDRLGQNPINLRERLMALSQQKRPEFTPSGKYEGPKYTKGE